MTKTPYFFLFFFDFGHVLSLKNMLYLLVTNNFKHFAKEERHIKKFKTVCLASLISLLGITAIFSTIKPTSGNDSTPTTQEETTAAERPLSNKPDKITK